MRDAFIMGLASSNAELCRDDYAAALQRIRDQLNKLVWVSRSLARVSDPGSLLQEACAFGAESLAIASCGALDRQMAGGGQHRGQGGPASAWTVRCGNPFRPLGAIRGPTASGSIHAHGIEDG